MKATLAFADLADQLPRDKTVHNVGRTRTLRDDENATSEELFDQGVDIARRSAAAFRQALLAV